MSFRKSFFKRLGLFSFLFLFFALQSPAFSQEESDYEAGYNFWAEDKPNEAIEAITRALDSGTLTETEIAASHYIRGYSYWEIDEDEKAVADLTAAIDAGLLNDETKGNAYRLRGTAYWILGDEEKTLEDLTTSISISPDPSDPLYRRAHFFLSKEENEDAFGDIFILATQFPDTMNYVGMRYVWNVVRWAKEEGKKDELYEFLLALRESKYTGPDGQYSTDGLMQELALLHLERGENNRALILIFTIDDTQTILETLVDNRYAALWETGVYKAHSFLDNVLEKELALNKAKMEEMPANTDVVQWYANSLRSAGRSEEAIAILKDALANQDRFEIEDEDDILWLKNELAYAYQDVADLENSFKMFEEILEVPLEENGRAVSQYINFSISLLEAGEFEKSLAQIKATTHNYSSDFGTMFLLMGEACVLHEIGQKDEAAALGDEIYQRWEDNPSAAQVALLCLERSDDAAELVINRLADEDQRTSVLVAIQDYLPGRPNLPYKAVLLDRYQAVLGRPEVMAEIDKYGRVIDVPLMSTYWGDF